MERLTHKARYEAGYKLNKGIKEWQASDRLGAYENTGLTPEQIISIATELKEYKQLELSPKRLSEHIAFCRRYRELFGAIDFNRLKELKERDAAKAPIYQVQGDERYEQDPEWWMCPRCEKVYDMDDDYDFCPNCGQRLKWEE